MQITCRKQDVEKFTDDWFCAESVDDQDGGLVEMWDCQVIPDTDKMPKDVPWVGRSEAGLSYGPCFYACDGKELREFPSGHDGGFVIRWDYDLNEPNVMDMADARKFVDVRERAYAAMRGIPEAEV